MRRLIALFSLMSLTNLVFVQAGSACPLVSAPHESAAPTGVHSEHGSSDAPVSHEMVHSMPDEGSSHGSPCLAMQACVATLDVATDPVVVVVKRPMRVDGTSDERPPSLTSTPEIPPPRA